MLDDAAEAATTDAVALRAALRTCEKEIGELIRTGQIASVGKNSANQSYAFGASALTLPAIAEGWRDLINLFDRCSEVVVADGQAATDPNILAEMRARCRPIYSTRPDLTNLRQTSGVFA